MTTLTLDRVLTDAGRLPLEEQQILEDLLRQRRVEAWRTKTATGAKESVAALRSGKLKAQSAEAVIARLRDLE